MTKLILLFIAYSVVMAILKKRAEKKAREQAAANGGAVEDDFDDIEYEAEAPPEHSRTRVMKGRPFLMSGEAAETSEDRNERPDPDRGERGPTKFEKQAREQSVPEKAKPEKYSAERHQPERMETKPQSASNRGQSILDQLAKELGLPTPTETSPQPSAPAPQPRPRPQTEVRPAPVAQPATKVAIPHGQDPWASRTALGRPAAAVSSSQQRLETSINKPNLARPDDMASAMVVQAILSEAPGLRYWRGQVARRHREVSPEANAATKTAAS